MARLIDANSILDDFLKRYTEMEKDGKLVFAACEIKQDFADMISNATTVDAVEVVRCKDCKYSTLPSMQTQIYGKPGTLTCHNRKSPCNRRNVASDDYCSYADRKDDNAT